MVGKVDSSPSILRSGHFSSLSANHVSTESADNAVARYYCWERIVHFEIVAQAGITLFGNLSSTISNQCTVKGPFA